MAKKKNILAKEGFNEILLYTTPNGNVKVEIYLQNQNIWLTQQKIAELFRVDKTGVTRHIGNILRRTIEGRTGMCKICTYHLARYYKKIEEQKKKK